VNLEDRPAKKEFARVVYQVAQKGHGRFVPEGRLRKLCLHSV
jgi:hypothetical protein